MNFLSAYRFVYTDLYLNDVTSFYTLHLDFSIKMEIYTRKRERRNYTSIKTAVSILPNSCDKKI